MLSPGDLVLCETDKFLFLRILQSMGKADKEQLIPFQYCLTQGRLTVVTNNLKMSVA